MPTIQDIADKLNISKSTVSKGLNNASDISVEMRRKILDTAVEMGYQNKRIMERTKTLCILMHYMECDTPNKFGHGIVLGFRQMAEPDGWNVVIVPVDDEFQKSVSYEEFMLTNDYHGSFVLGFSLKDPWMEDFKTTRFPTVLYDNYLKSNPKIASVSCDNQEGFDLAVKYLKQLGHKKIGLISGPQESYILTARNQAYVKALEKYGLEINEDYIGIGYHIAASVHDHLQRLYDLGVTAILFSHDTRAFAAMTECLDHKIRIPADLSIIGFDDLPMAAYTNPPLTTIRQDRLSIGKTGYYAMSCLINNIPIGSILLRAPLIIRESTGKPRKMDA